MTGNLKGLPDGVPHTHIDELIEEQLAKLASLGLDPADVETTDFPFLETKLSERGDDGWMIPTGVTHYRCPIIDIDGAQRLILPNGDVETAAADPD